MTHAESVLSQYDIFNMKNLKNLEVLQKCFGPRIFRSKGVESLQKQCLNFVNLHFNVGEKTFLCTCSK